MKMVRNDRSSNQRVNVIISFAVYLVSFLPYVTIFQFSTKCWIILSRFYFAENGDKFKDCISSMQMMVTRGKVKWRKKIISTSIFKSVVEKKSSSVAKRIFQFVQFIFAVTRCKNILEQNERRVSKVETSSFVSQVLGQVLGQDLFQKIVTIQYLMPEY